MSPQFTTYLWTDFIASIERCTGNSVYSYQARPAYRNAILFIGKIPSDGIARKITKKRREILLKCLRIVHRFDLNKIINVLHNNKIALHIEECVTRIINF